MNSINNAAYEQTWNWNSLAGANGLTLSTSSTAATGNTQTLLNLAMSGANATSTQTTYGAQIANTHTGTASTNVGLYATASGGSNNYAAIFNGGNVGIGTSGPAHTHNPVRFPRRRIRQQERYRSHERRVLGFLQPDV